MARRIAEQATIQVSSVKDCEINVFLTPKQAMVILLKADHVRRLVVGTTGTRPTDSVLRAQSRKLPERLKCMVAVRAPTHTMDRQMDPRMVIRTVIKMATKMETVQLRHTLITNPMKP